MCFRFAVLCFVGEALYFGWFLDFMCGVYENWYDLHNTDYIMFGCRVATSSCPASLYLCA